MSDATSKAEKEESGDRVVLLAHVKKLTVGDKGVGMALNSEQLSAREFKKLSNFINAGEAITVTMEARQLPLFAENDVAPGPESEPTPPPWSGEKPKSKRGRPKANKTAPDQPSTN
jgi:hypothetical protein